MSLAIDFLRVFQVAILILGIIVVYYATKGYRKTRSKSLAFLALGFVFVTIGAAVAGLLFEFLNYDLASIEALEAASEVVGLFLIVYSILWRRD
jgi:uncharacterized membrane protein